MNRKWLAVPLWVWVLFLTACSHDFGLMKVNERLNGYASAMRWGQYETALQYHAVQPTKSLDFDKLRDVRVTAYRSLDRQDAVNGSSVVQTVEIRYIGRDGVVEKSITQRQHWHYDSEKGTWFLDSAFPQFK